MHTPVVSYKRALFQLIQLPLQWKRNREDARYIHMEFILKYIYTYTQRKIKKKSLPTLSKKGKTFQRTLSVRERDGMNRPGQGI